MRTFGTLGLVLAAAVAACSPYNYGDEVKAISKSVDQLSAGLTGATSGLTADYNANLQSHWARTHQPIRLRTNCLDPVQDLPKTKEFREAEEAGRPPPLDEEQKENQAPCTLIEGAITQPPVRSKEPPPVMTNEEGRARALRSMALLKAYAQGLAAVTNAEDRASYNAAVGKLSSAVESIAKLAPVPGAGAIAAAGVNLFGWLIGTSLDQQRFATLKEAVNKVGRPPADDPDGRPPIAVVANSINVYFAAVNEARLGLLNQDVRASLYPLSDPKKPFSEEAYRRRLAEVNPKVDAIEALRRTTFAWRGLANAHEKLVKAVNEGGVNIGDLQEAIGEFIDKVEAARKAIDTAAKAASGGKGG